MIRLEGVCKRFKSGKVVADDIWLTLPPGQAIALLGANGAGKSSLLALIAGTMRPDRGRVTVRGSVSWPVGFQGSFHPDLTGRQNTRFVARSYGADTNDLIDFTERVSELGPSFDQPVRHYSSGERARLGFAVSMGIPFDTYLVDEVISVGDARFRRKSAMLLRARLRQAGAIIVSHAAEQLDALCSSAALLHEGRLTYFDNLAEAQSTYARLLGGVR